MLKKLKSQDEITDAALAVPGSPVPTPPWLQAVPSYGRDGVRSQSTPIRGVVLHIRGYNSFCVWLSPLYSYLNNNDLSQLGVAVFSNLLALRQL